MASGMEPLVLNLPQSVQIVVPPFLGCITTYVLLEQEDWFEPDIAFLRQAVKPGMKIIYIGANFGVYTLCLAHTVGPTGHVWSIEPAENTARYVQKSIEINGFHHVDLLVAAVSSHAGEGFLAHGRNEEMHSLDLSQSTQAAKAEGGEVVALITIDGLMERENHPSIDVLKIDAEGHEIDILKGAGNFLHQQAPLVMFEVLEQNGGMNAPLVTAFAQAGYQIFRLVPGLNILIPTTQAIIEKTTPVNVYALKSDSAAHWLEAGLVALTPSQFDSSDIDNILCDRLGQYWQSVSWAKSFSPAWLGWLNHAMNHDDNRDYARALGWWLIAHQTDQTANDRAGALQLAEQLIEDLCLRQPDLNLYTSLVRVKRDQGDRPGALKTIMAATELWAQGSNIDDNKPILPLIDEDWQGEIVDLNLLINITVIRLMDCYEGYSTVYRVKRGQLLNALIVEHPWASLEVERRLLLTKAALNQQIPQIWPASDRLKKPGPQSLNYHVWSEAAKVRF